MSCCKEKDCSERKERFEGKKRKYSSRGCALGKVCNPVAEEVKDPLYQTYSIRGIANYIPLYEGGDATYKFWQRMAALSPTHGSIISNIGRYAFGGGFTVNKRGDGFAELQKTAVTPTQFKEYSDFVKSWTDPLQLMESAREQYTSLKIWGNAGAIVTVSKVAGVSSIQYKAYDADQFRYLEGKANDPVKYMIVAPSFDQHIINSTEEIDIVPVYPAFEEVNGVRRTFIHIKNKVAGRTWYGEPDSRQSVYFQFLEYQLGQYTTQGYRKGWTPKSMIEQYGDLEDEAGDAEFKEALANTFTNEGDAQQVIVRTIPTGMDKSTVFNFPSNTDHQFHESMSNIASSKIYTAHDWHPILNEKTPGSLGSSQEFQAVFKVKYWTVIKPIQDTILNGFVNVVCKIAEQELGYVNNDSLSLGINSLFMDMLVEQPKNPLAELSGGIGG